MNIIVGAYSHITHGSSVEEYSQLLDRQLRPLLTLAFSNPDFRFVLRLGIPYIQWLETNHPEINMLIADLCRNKRLEMLSSSFSDCILPLEPAHERSAHIEKTNTYLRKRFNKRPRGLWCIEQVFSPGIIQIMDLSSLDYIILSSYNQNLNQTLVRKPFRMEELGKTTVILPSDDRFSKEVAECGNEGCTAKSLNNAFDKLLDSLSGNEVIMLNMDQLLSCEGSSAVYKTIIEKTADKTVLPYDFISEREISSMYYIPSGVYGRDFNIEKSVTLNQYILNNPLLNRMHRCINLMRDCSKSLKKNSDNRKLVEYLLMNASTGMIYIPEVCLNPEIRHRTDAALSEIEKVLRNEDMLPATADLDGDLFPEYITGNKFYSVYLNTKGAVVSRLNLFSIKSDVALNQGQGFFRDTIRNGKAYDLSVRRWEMTPVDRKRQDFFAKSPLIEVNKSVINITKHFKTRQNSIIVDYDVENMGKTTLKDLVFETVLNLSIPGSDSFTDMEGNIIDEKGRTSDRICISNRINGLYFELVANSDFLISTRNVFADAVTPLGVVKQYQYTQIKIQKNIILPGSEAFKCSFTLKAEKRRGRQEKQNDT